MILISVTAIITAIIITILLMIKNIADAWTAERAFDGQAA